MTMDALWEILVPTVRNDGRPFRTRYHRVWDAKVRKITGGLTIMPVAQGQWVHGDYLFKERMIPVRIKATKEQMEKIIQMTLEYYDQIAVMAYKISDEVLLVFGKEYCKFCGNKLTKALDCTTIEHCTNCGSVWMNGVLQ